MKKANNLLMIPFGTFVGTDLLKDTAESHPFHVQWLKGVPLKTYKNNRNHFPPSFSTHYYADKRSSPTFNLRSRQLQWVGCLVPPKLICWVHRKLDLKDSQLGFADERPCLMNLIRIFQVTEKVEDGRVVEVKGLRWQGKRTWGADFLHSGWGVYRTSCQRN